MNKECTTRGPPPPLHSPCALASCATAYIGKSCARCRRRLAIRAARVACTQCWMVGKNPSRPRCGKVKTHSSSPTVALETRFICKGKEAIVSTHSRYPLICTTYMQCGLTPLTALTLAMALASIVTKPVISEAI